MDCPPNLGIICPSNEEVEVSILFWFWFMHNYYIDISEVFRTTRLTWPLHLQAFVEAVHAGDIFWHAMPFNTQVEMFDAPLLQYAVELTHELDAKFGQKPKRAMSQV